MRRRGPRVTGFLQARGGSEGEGHQDGAERLPTVLEYIAGGNRPLCTPGWGRSGRAPQGLGRGVPAVRSVQSMNKRAAQARARSGGGGGLRVALRRRFGVW